MDAVYFLKMIEDKSFTDLKKMQYKYSRESVAEMLELLKENRYRLFPMRDFSGQPIIYFDELTRISPKYAKLLLAHQSDTQGFGMHAMEEEIFSTFEIENINTSRESIRKILAGYAPRDVGEERIFGMKKGLEFVSDYRNEINEENEEISESEKAPRPTRKKRTKLLIFSVALVTILALFAAVLGFGGGSHVCIAQPVNVFPVPLVERFKFCVGHRSIPTYI